jgi:chemotaxis protein CheD
MSTDYASIAALGVQRLPVQVGDLAVSADTAVVISTYALGSCVAVAAYDSTAKVGGILHLMLPDSAMAPEKAARQPAMFANTGLPLFFRALAGLNARRSHLRLFVGGGASVLRGPDSFQIGGRNVTATLSFLADQGWRVRKSELGGTTNRTLHLEVANGTVTLHTPSGNRQYSLAA